MNLFLYLSILFITQISNAQYLGGSNFQYQIASDNIIEVFQNNNGICEIDLKNEKIINDYYWFEDGLVYEIDVDYEQIIGKYSSNEIEVYQETYILSKPIFSKMKLQKVSDSNFQIKIASSADEVKIEEEKNQASDVLKLWLIMKATQRVEQRNKNATIIVESIILSSNFL